MQEAGAALLSIPTIALHGQASREPVVDRGRGCWYPRHHPKLMLQPRPTKLLLNRCCLSSSMCLASLQHRRIKPVSSSSSHHSLSRSADHRRRACKYFLSPSWLPWCSLGLQLFWCRHLQFSSILIMDWCGLRPWTLALQSGLTSGTSIFEPSFRFLKQN